MVSSTWVTYLQTFERKTLRTCSTNKALSATSISRTAPENHPSPSLNSGTRETQKTWCMVAIAMITLDTVCRLSFLEEAVVQAEAAVGVEVAEHPEATMAPHAGDLKTEWLSLNCLQVEAGRI